MSESNNNEQLEKETSRKYCVYMHENKFNKKKYIGITGKEPKIRWANGRGYTGCTHFYNAIQKYGWDNFEHKILHTNLSKKEACEKEIELIKKYDTTNENKGYNISSGGEGIRIISHWDEWNKRISDSHFGGLNPVARKVVWIDTDYNLIKIYDCGRDAERELGLATSKILDVCHHKAKHTGGKCFMFYEEYISNVDNLKSKKIQIKPYRIPIMQYDLSGNFIKEYSCVAQASKQTGIDEKSIAWVGRGKMKTAGGYLWRYK